MSAPKSVKRATCWDSNVEEAYRFQIAGYRDESEYVNIHPSDSVRNSIDRWPHNNYIKKLKRKDGYFYYYNKERECSDKDLHKIKMYSY